MGKNENIWKRSILDDVSTDFKKPNYVHYGYGSGSGSSDPDSVNLMNPDPFLTDVWRGQEDWEYEEEYAEEYAVCSLEDMLALLQSDDEVLKETVSRDE